MSRPLANVGVPNVPTSANLERSNFDTWIRNTLLSLQAALIAPSTITNFRATALAGAIQIDFTRSDGTGYLLVWNTTPSLQNAVMIDLGTANKYVDSIGDGSITRWYAIQARKGSVVGQWSAWISQTTLALGTSVTPPTPPPATETPFTDQETEAIAVQIEDKGSYSPL